MEEHRTPPRLLSGPCTETQPFLLHKGEHPISRRDIDPDVIKIIYRLHGQGFTAYLVGGAVRDLLLGKPPKDFDVATDARPGQIKKRFRNAFLIGRRFRLAHIHFADGKIIEVATFRRDPENAPERCPEPAAQGAASAHRPDEEHLKIYGTPGEDAFRRDTTINGLFFDVITSTVIDYVGGLEDMARRTVRMIGDPGERFAEDPVRIWRVIRQAARLGFVIDPETERAIPSDLHLLGTCSGSRLFEELNKDLGGRARPTIEALNRHGALPFILGRIGEAYAADPDLFDRLLGLLEVKDQDETGLPPAPPELYALLFWPWAEPILSRAEGDPNAALKESYAAARPQAQIPKALLASVIQVQVILAGMIAALQTGRMRWSLREKSHFDQATRLCFMVFKGRPPGPQESFLDLYREVFPGSTPKRRKRRRKPRRRRPAHPPAEPGSA